MNAVQELQELVELDRSLLFVLDDKGQTLLHAAVRRDCFEVAVVMLLYHGPKNMPDSQGHRPIDLAVSNQQVDMTRLLLAAGCDPWRIRLKESKRLVWEDINPDIKSHLRIAELHS